MEFYLIRYPPERIFFFCQNVANVHAICISKQKTSISKTKQKMHPHKEEKVSFSNVKYLQYIYRFSLCSAKYPIFRRWKNHVFKISFLQKNIYSFLLNFEDKFEFIFQIPG